ncbi:MAG: MBL fold metallo-hydrolase [Synergistaceae bacterium]|nr:MBL fold metallo-hydrolase [Synergistaceae bacterium]
MELKQLGERTWYIPGRVNVGYYEEDGKGYLIDTGLDDDHGKKILRLLNETRGAPLRAIVNTHSNADHIGGNALIQKRTNCEVWATRIEGVMTEWTPLESLWLWSAWPFREIRGKFIEAKPSKVTFIDEAKTESEYPIMDTALTAVPLPGHYLDMIGVKTPDGVFFVADALFDPAILEKYRFCVMIDVEAGYRTLDMLENSRAVTWFVPCHAPAVREIGELARRNREAQAWVTEAVYDVLTPGRALSREDILAEIGLAHHLEMDAAHLLLNLSSVSAHLTYLSMRSRIKSFVRDCRLLWVRTGETGGLGGDAPQ